MFNWKRWVLRRGKIKSDNFPVDVENILLELIHSIWMKSTAVKEKPTDNIGKRRLNPPVKRDEFDKNCQHYQI